MKALLTVRREVQDCLVVARVDTLNNRCAYLRGWLKPIV